MHCKYLPVVPYNALEKFSKALYGTTGGTYSARVFRPVMFVLERPGLKARIHKNDLCDFTICTLSI